MGFKNGAYATVWSVEKRGNMDVARLSISKKDKNTGDYNTEFSGFVALCTNDNVKIQRLKREIQQNNKARIKLGDTNVTQKSVKGDNDEWKVYTNFYTYDFDFADSSPAPARVTRPEEDEELPF